MGRIDKAWLSLNIWQSFLRLYVLCIISMSINTNAALAGLSDSLAAYYPFNGNANDESGNGDNGTMNRTPEGSGFKHEPFIWKNLKTPACA